MSGELALLTKEDAQGLIQPGNIRLANINGENGHVVIGWIRDVLQLVLGRMEGGLAEDSSSLGINRLARAAFRNATVVVPLSMELVNTCPQGGCFVQRSERWERPPDTSPVPGHAFAWSNNWRPGGRRLQTVNDPACAAAAKEQVENRTVHRHRGAATSLTPASRCATRSGWKGRCAAYFSADVAPTEHISATDQNSRPHSSNDSTMRTNSAHQHVMLSKTVAGSLLECSIEFDRDQMALDDGKSRAGRRETSNLFSCMASLIHTIERAYATIGDLFPPPGPQCEGDRGHQKHTDAAASTDSTSEVCPRPRADRVDGNDAADLAEPWSSATTTAKTSSEAGINGDTRRRVATAIDGPAVPGVATPRTRRLSASCSATACRAHQDVHRRWGHVRAPQPPPDSAGHHAVAVEHCPSEMELRPSAG